MDKFDYDKLTASELLDLRDSIDREKETEKIKFLDQLIEERRQSIKKELEKGRFEYKYSTLFPRIAAMLLDGYLIVPFRWIEALVLEKLTGSLLEFFIWFVMVDMLLYSILFHSLFGQTIGKKLVGIKVVNFKDETKISYKQAIIRDLFPLLVMSYLFFTGYSSKVDVFDINIPLIVTSVYFLWYVVEVITMLFNKKRRALHDYLAGTISIRN